ncbi:DUF4124 domain-containing protein [Pseudoxanthomonas composti]|uniref:DUF4124 domain-containing protein n=1 Tax=Pseudoxanthomonas composti TaxID=2137479 RepID=A0A4Q1JS70_9GAMM|nr:DUF4124 domain-containing protein [Pseudoxanthomonas composti]RXR01977.1 DUF4124 domain-containing protein [Pseudoxanthomonas composti]
MSLRPALSIALLLTALPAAADTVTLYRCTDKAGHETIRDTPCAAGQSQRELVMQRPQDPPPRAVSAGVGAPQLPAPAPAPTVTQVIYRTPPRLMYECVTPEGQTYTSDSGEGNPRQVPLWASGYGPVGAGGPHRPGVYVGTVVPLGTTWVRDTCNALPQQEVCARLSDRRWEIQRRYNSALQSERQALDREQRGIDARMANDCGNG